MIEKYFSIFFIALILGCSYEPTQKNYQATYDILIRNVDHSIVSKRLYFDDLISSDSVYLFMETGFEVNYLSIYINNELQLQETISTFGHLGLSECYTFNRSRISTIGIRIDDGQLLQIEPAPEQNIWRVNYIKDSILVAFNSKHAPFYD